MAGMDNFPTHAYDLAFYISLIVSSRLSLHEFRSKIPWSTWTTLFKVLHEDQKELWVLCAHQQTRLLNCCLFHWGYFCSKISKYPAVSVFWSLFFQVPKPENSFSSPHSFSAQFARSLIWNFFSRSFWEDRGKFLRKISLRKLRPSKSRWFCSGYHRA